MKYVIPALLMIVTLSSVSCKKDYTCSCKNENIGKGFDYPLVDFKKQDAEKECESITYEWETTGGTCELTK